MAKEQGLKFTFGSDTRDKKAGRLDYCKQIAKKCKLTKDDFFIPDRQSKDLKQTYSTREIQREKKF